MQIEPSKHRELRDPMTNAVVALAVETASDGYGALIFCGSRRSCQSMARLVSQAMPACSIELLEKRRDVVHELRGLPLGFDEALESTIPRGVGFHRKLCESLTFDHC